MRSLIIYSILFIFALPAFSQEISGVVYGLENGKKQPLPGVNIYWEKTTLGTTSDASGNFKIRQRNGQHMLVFSFVGFETQTVHISGQAPLEVVLEPNLQIGEVTVVQKDRGTYMSTIDPIHTERIGGAELHKAACCNLAESFETNPSVDVSYNDAVSGAKQIRLLGLEGIYSQLQTENISNFRGLATNFGLTYIPGPWMESIQVSKGTASVVNGYESITGQINVDFKKPDGNEKLHLNGFASADGKTEFNANGNIRLHKDMLTSGVFVHAENLSNRIDHNGDGFLDHPLSTQYHLFNTWKYNNHKGMMLHGSLRYLYDDRQGGSILFRGGQQTGNPYGIGMKNNLAEAVFKAGYVWPSQHTAIALLSNFVTHDMESFYGNNLYDAGENRLYANLVFTVDLDTASRHMVNAGVSIFSDSFDETLNVRAMDRRETVPGLFAEYTYKPSEKMTFLAGIRADHHNMFGTFITPRAHLRYQPVHFLTLRMSAGKGYRTANVLAENSHLLSNWRFLDFDEAVQEEAWNYGISFISKHSVWNRELQVTGEFYRTDFIKQLVIDRETSAQSILLKPLNGDSWANSYQLDLRYPVVKNLDLTLAWRINDVRQTIGGELLRKPFVSRYKGLVTMNYTTNLKKWMFDYTLQFNGGGRLPEYPDLASGPGHSMPETTFPAYTVMNAQITRYFREWSIYAGSENLTDFMQHQPVLGADKPFEPGFSATNIWGPVSGRRIYAGIRFTLNYE